MRPYTPVLSLATFALAIQTHEPRAGIVCDGSSPDISLDPWRCDRKSCKSGELCVKDNCWPLNIGNNHEFCGSSKAACAPGQWCNAGKCSPIQIILDPFACGSETCKAGELCVNDF